MISSTSRALAIAVLPLLVWAGCGTSETDIAPPDDAGDAARPEGDSAGGPSENEASVPGDSASGDDGGIADGSTEAQADADAGPTCSAATLMATLPAHFVATAPKSRCSPQGTVNAAAVTATYCAAACGGATGCPVTLDWHDATIAGTKFDVKLDATIVIDINGQTVAGPINCTLTGVVTDAPYTATVSVDADAGVMATGVETDAMTLPTATWTGCATLGGLANAVISSVGGPAMEQMRDQAITIARETIAKHTCP